MTFLLPINILAVAASAVLSFFIGMIWYSALFGTAWLNELKKHNVTIEEPTKADLYTKLAFSALINTTIATAVGLLVSLTGCTTLAGGLTLGLIAACGFTATTLGSVFLWESRSLKLFLIDIGYPALSIIASALVLSLWH